MESAGTRISTLLKEKNMTQKQLAKLTGVTESALSHYVKGDRTPRSDVLSRIAKALGTTTDYLLGNEVVSAQDDNKLTYLQRNLGKLDEEQLKKAETVLKAVFDDIFEDEEDD